MSSDLVSWAVLGVLFFAIMTFVTGRVRKARRAERERIEKAAFEKLEDRMESGYENLERNRDLSPDERLRRNDGLR